MSSRAQRRDPALTGKDNHFFISYLSYIKTFASIRAGLLRSARNDVIGILELEVNFSKFFRDLHGKQSRKQLEYLSSAGSLHCVRDDSWGVKQ